MQTVLSSRQDRHQLSSKAEMGISEALHMLGWLGQSSVPSRDELVFQNVLSCLFLVLVSKCAFPARR